MRLGSCHKGFSIKKDVLKNFAIFIEKPICWSLFLIKLLNFSPETLLERLQHRFFLMNIAEFLRTLFLETSTYCDFCRLPNFLQSYRKPNWNEVWIKIKICCLLWKDFTTCLIVFADDFEQVNKISLDIFIETMLAYLLNLLIENFTPECCLNGYDLGLYQTMFHYKTALFVVYKWALRTELVVIKLTEIKWKFLKFAL